MEMKKFYFGEKRHRNNECVCDEDMIVPIGNFGNFSSRDDLHIDFYSEVNDMSVKTLNQQLREKTILSQSLSNKFDIEPPPIRLHIQSYGGVLFSGIAGMEAIRNNPVPVYTYIDGIAASAATYMSCVGTKRFMYKNSSILIHQLSTGFWGKFDELMDELQNSQMLMNQMNAFYNEYTTMKKSMLDNILKRDIYITTEKALENGLIDEII